MEKEQNIIKKVHEYMKVIILMINGMEKEKNIIKKEAIQYLKMNFRIIKDGLVNVKNIMKICFIEI